MEKFVAVDKIMIFLSLFMWSYHFLFNVI